ncbi:MAG: class I tRNA ligase family protein, partial [Firmicutes bacterium]|nr:class I tRNA ligase family protein [Bacillota bacterium]
LERVAALTDMVSGRGATPALESAFHKTIKKVSSDIEELKFNTAIASMMSLLNLIYDTGSLTKDELLTFIKLISPFAPHLAEEMNEYLGGRDFIAVSEWPSYDESKTVDEVIEIAVQVNGKLRATIEVPAGIERDEAVAAAKTNERIAELTSGKTVVKEIYVPGKIVNIVVK